MKPFRKTRIAGLFRRSRFRLWHIWKTLYWRCHSNTHDEKRILLIFGCQRSGTSLLARIFNNDIRALTRLSEDNCLTGTAESRLRMRPLTEVNGMIRCFRFPFVIVKPLVESQNAIRILNALPRSKAIWMFRSYKDVVNSNLKRFQRQVINLRAIDERQPNNWRSEGLSATTHAVVAKYFRDDMSRADAAALFWYTRNVLFYELHLDEHDDVMMCRYENLVSDPHRTMRSIYKFVDLSFPGRDIAREVDGRSLLLGQRVVLNPEIEELCDGLQSRLERSLNTKHRPCMISVPSLIDRLVTESAPSAYIREPIDGP